MNEDMKLYYDYTISPLGKLYYKTICEQLKHIKGKRILDFGSGFAFTTNFLAKHNQVIALEADKSMIEEAKPKENYEQIHGDLNYVKSLEDESFDFITCHLVLEFVEDRQSIIDELLRVLKKDGILSVVRHNKKGRIIQAITLDYDLEDAKVLLKGGYSYSSAFGDIKYYSNEDLLSLCKNRAIISQVQGARVLGSLHNENMQNKQNWVDDMFNIEWELLKDKDFINIAYFNHIFLKKL